MIVLYEAVDNYQADRSQNEDSERIELSERPPVVGDFVQMNSDRRWKVVCVETYYGKNGVIVLALVSLEGVTVPAREQWFQAEQRQEYPEVCLNVQQFADGRLHHYGWGMTGNPPGGRLFGAEPTEHPTLMRTIPLPLAVSEVDTYRPSEESSYTAIHVCHVVAVDLPEMAVA